MGKCKSFDMECFLSPEFESNFPPKGTSAGFYARYCQDSLKSPIDTRFEIRDKTVTFMFHSDTRLTSCGHMWKAHARRR